MPNVIGVRFRQAGRVYYFDPGENEIKPMEHVIVETARGVEYGTVVLGVKEVAEEKITQPLKGIIRVATYEDEEKNDKNRELEREAFKLCQEKIKSHELEMKLIGAEYTFDNNKILFYFTAEGRIDFRDLVKDLAAVFRTRIELRQIGVRDETKILGGIGVCGRALCCHTYLPDFSPVSIKMAKEQNLSLNPTKISGVCGRLMCCLSNEQETYEYLNSKLPNLGDAVILPDGMRGEVHSVSVLRQTVKVLVSREDKGKEEKEIEEYPIEELKFRSRKGRKDRTGAEGDTEELTAEELEILEGTENRKEDSQATERKTKKNRSRQNENRDAAGETHTSTEPSEKASGEEPNSTRENRKREGRDGEGNDRGRNGRDRNAQGRNGRGRNEREENRSDKRNAAGNEQEEGSREKTNRNSVEHGGNDHGNRNRNRTGRNGNGQDQRNTENDSTKQADRKNNHDRTENSAPRKPRKAKYVRGQAREGSMTGETEQNGNSNVDSE